MLVGPNQKTPQALLTEGFKSESCLRSQITLLRKLSACWLTPNWLTYPRMAIVHEVALSPLANYTTFSFRKALPGAFSPSFLKLSVQGALLVNCRADSRMHEGLYAGGTQT